MGRWPAPALSLADLDGVVGAFVLDYNDRTHSELGISPRAAWIADGWLPQSPAAQEMVDLLLATREAAGRTDPIVIGHITAPLYVGEPGWDAGPHTITGSAASIAERLVTGAPGAVNQIQVRFRARSREELCDQLDAFAADGLPLLHTA